MKKTITILVIIAMVISVLPTVPVQAASQAESLVSVAKTQIGVKERSSNSDDIVYNDWYYGKRVNNNGVAAKYAWCAAFVSWCANQAGIPTSVIPKTNNTTNMKNLLISSGGTSHLKGSGYQPKHGDIIFFGTDASQHVGIVDYSSGNTVYYIDGNNTQTNPHGVHNSSCSLSYSSLWGFVTPNYSGSVCNCSESYKGNYIVNTTSLPLTMRSGHGTEYSQVTTIPKGTQVYVSKADGSWAHVEWNGKTGYCSLQYLKKVAQDVRTNVDIGTDFYARIVNIKLGNVVANQNGNVTSRTNTASADRLWKFERQSDKSYKIINCLDGTVLDVYGVKTDTGTKIISDTSNNGANQRWYIQTNGNGHALVPAHATGMALDIWEISAADGAEIVIHPWVNNDEAEIFKIEKVTDLSNYYGNVTKLKIYSDSERKNECTQFEEGATAYFSISGKNASQFKFTLSDSSGSDEKLITAGGWNLPNLKVGSYTLKVTPINAISSTNGAATTNYKVVKKLTTDMVTFGTNSYTYNGSQKKPGITVKNGTTTLVAGTDYSTTYANNTNAGTATVTVTGKGNYVGTVSKTFTIGKANQDLQMSISKSTIKVGETAAITTNGQGTLSYSSSNNSVATVNSKGIVTGKGEGNAKITVSASGNANYNSVQKTITIIVENKIADISEAQVTLDKDMYEYDGNAKKPDVAVINDGITLIKDTDYTVDYTNNVNAGTATVIITGKGNYVGSLTKSFIINDKTESVPGDSNNITNAKILVDNKTVQAGDVITVPVRLENNPGIVSFRIYVTYDSKVLTLVNATEKDFKDTSFGPQDKNPYTILWSDSIHEDNTTDGIVANLEFKANADATLGNSKIKISYEADDVFNGKFENVTFETVDGIISIEEKATEKILKNISITSYPKKLHYYVGDTVDLSGLGVQALFSDGTTTDVEDYVVNTQGLTSTAGKKTVVVMYLNDGIGKTAFFEIVVTEQNVKDEESKEDLKEEPKEDFEENPVCHQGGTATCSSKAVCEICGDEYGEFNPQNHNGGIEIQDSFVATEEEEGYTGDVYCLGCNAIVMEGREIPKLKHDNTEAAIEVPNVKIKKVSNVKGRKVKVEIKKVKSVAGYEIMYSTDKNFKKAKTKTTGNTKYTIRNLKKGKRYYVQVRAYVKADGKMYYGKWSSVKELKVKK